MANQKESLSYVERMQQVLISEKNRPYHVPENWVWTKGETIFLPMETKKPVGEFFSYVDIDSIDNQNQRITAPKKLKTAEAPSRASRGLKVGDTVFSLVRPYLKNISYIDETLADSIASTGFYVCRPSSAINPRFLYWLMCSDFVVDGLNKFMKGDNSPSIRKQDIEDFFYPLPPFSEQQRIVDRIESLFRKLDQAKELVQSILASFETRKSAILNKAFSGELTAKWREEYSINLDIWTETKIKNICKVVRGGSPRPAGDPRYYDGTIPFMKVADITRNDTMYVNSTEYTIKEAGLKKTRLVLANTLLLTNSGATLGVPAICTFNTTFNDGIAAFLDVKDDIKFLYYFWISKTGELRRINKGVAQPNLNIEIIGEININLPLLPEQAEIVRILDSIFEKERKAKEIIDVISNIEKMKRTILSRAFRGEIGTNDPNEDSAKELLKKIIMAKMNNASIIKTEVRMEVSKVQLTIIEALNKYGKLTPEQLKTETELEIDEFYNKVKELVNSGVVKETRESDMVYLEVVRNAN